ncbi:MAG TPA: tetratricopeptide repeat protein, partial [Gemmataceae bacterium]|nr:tetratricopeptide repeat protein [Gemmataceae bacterium]
EVCTGLAALDTHDGRLDGAREAGETARRLWEELRDEAPGDPRCSDRLAAVLLTLGSVYERLGRSADSAAVLRQAIALWERLAGEGFTPTRCLVAAATARRFLADRMSEQGRSGEVTRLYEENRARLDGLISAGNTAPEVRQELLYTLSELGEQYQHDGMQAEADRCWRRGHDLGRQLADEIPDNPRVVYCLAVCGQNLAARDPAAAHPAEITRLCRQAARLLEAQRQRDPTNQDTGRTLADVYFSLSDSSQQAGRPGEALRAARRAVEVLADLTDHRPDDPAARLDLFVGQARLAVREQQCGDPAAAKATARRAVEGFEQFCEAQASGPGATAVAAPCCGSLAAALRHAGALDLSLRVAERCRRMFEELVRRRADDPRHLIGLSEAWTQIGKVHWRGDRHELTEAALRESAAAATRLAECWPEYGQLRDERRRRLGRFLEERGRVAEAAAYLRPPE